MSGWKQYIISVIFCAFSCGLVSQIVSDTGSKALVRLISGMVIAVTIFQPLSRMNLESILEVPVMDWNGAANYVAEGENAASEEQVRRITGACETYILDKAGKLGTDIAADITLNEDLLPVSAVIRGEVPPDLQAELQEILTMDLGIPKENQKWIWNPENNN